MYPAERNLLTALADAPLSRYERGFVQSIGRRSNPLTPKQRAFLWTLADLYRNYLDFPQEVWLRIMTIADRLNERIRDKTPAPRLSWRGRMMQRGRVWA